MLRFILFLHNASKASLSVTAKINRFFVLRSSQQAAGIDLKENLAAGGAPWPYPSVYHPYDAAFGYPFNS